MPDKTSHPNKRSSRAWRAVALWICCAAAVGGLGCATMIVSEKSNPNAYAHYNKPVLTDSIFALGRPDAAFAKKIGYEDAIAFLGKQHTYLLVEGGEQLSALAHGELDGDKLIMEGTQRQLFLSKKTLWGQVAFRYAPGQGTPQAEADAAKLRALGFKADNQGGYRLSIPVKGVVGPAAKLKKDLPDALTKNRDIAFYNPPDSKPPPDLGKLIEVPLAVVADVALTPVYVVGFVILILSN